MGTATLLDVCHSYYLKIKNKKKHFKFLHVSTDEVFGSLELDGKMFNEDSPYLPNSPYSASKAGSDHLVRSWNKTFGLPTIITNCSNNYGPYQYPEKLIPLIISSIFDKKPLPIYGDGQNIRDWLFVDDHCCALNGVLEKGIPGDSYCIGGNNEITNLDLVKAICEIF